MGTVGDFLDQIQADFRQGFDRRGDQIAQFLERKLGLAVVNRMSILDKDDGTRSIQVDLYDESRVAEVSLDDLRFLADSFGTTKIEVFTDSDDPGVLSLSVKDIQRWP